ncbi:MAG: PDZ domain-containing protein [Desulfobacterales bacterium]|nr:PDZ domain-containing protein [Desulfobacterales bacterium]
MNKGLIWFGPISVVAFVLILAVMYGLVGNIGDLGPSGEQPEMNFVHNVQTFPSGVGDVQNGQIQLINKPSFPTGIGNGQIQLIKQNNSFPAGIGNDQIQLIKQNQIQTPYLGINIGEVPEAVARELKIPVGTGVYVKSIITESPSEKAGIKTGDIVLRFDHQPITSHEQIGRTLKTKKAGDVVKLVINRNGKKKSFHVKLESVPADIVPAAAALKKPSWMGADIQDIDAVIRMQFKLPNKDGVIISYVTPNSPAETAGLKVGDVIERFGGTRIRDVKQMRDLILGSQSGQQAMLTVFRNGETLSLPVIMGQQVATKETIPFLGPADMAIEGTWIGMDVTELLPEDASALGLPPSTKGILVNDVESPPATMIGFQTGDVIIAINSIPTPDMKGFVKATEKQSSAVVDLLRGNRHIFMSVPPPGYTQQGSKINNVIDNKVKQVAVTTQVNGIIAISSESPDLNAAIPQDINQSPYLILVDLNKNSYATVSMNGGNSLSNIVGQYNITSLICGNIPVQTANNLSSNGVFIYSGIVGTANDAISLYESGSLTAAR